MATRPLPDISGFRFIPDWITVHSACILIATLVSGCAYYSFTGASIPSRLDTIAIPLVRDNSSNPLSALDQNLTDLLVERFARQTRLSFASTESDADAVLEATIESYTNRPTSVTGEERATLNRVTLAVSVRYYDQVEDKVLMQDTFSSSEEYDPVTEGLEGQRRAALVALENIADDAFTQATSNW